MVFSLQQEEIISNQCLYNSNSSTFVTRDLPLLTPANTDLSKAFENMLLLPECAHFSPSIYRSYYKLILCKKLQIRRQRDLGWNFFVTFPETVAASFPILRQLRSVCRSVLRSVLQSLVSSFVLYLLDYGNATLGCILSHLIKRMQWVMHSVARLVFSATRYDRITLILTQLH